MKNKNKLLIMGLVSLLLFANIMAFNTSDKFKEFNPYITLNLDKNVIQLPSIEDNRGESNAKALENDTGCSSVVVHVNPGHDVVSYRRDSKNSADTIIEEMNFNGQKAIHEYKIQGGYFTHIIITEDGWIICIGGRDNPDTNKQLEKLGSDIISRGSIQKEDINNANAIVKKNRWGHFLIKSPDDNVGVTGYDSRNIANPSNMTDMLKMNDGDYVKIANNPNFYVHGQFNKFNSDPIDAAIKILGEDAFGLDRRDIITYEYTKNNNTTKANVWASFDGGALLTGARGYPDNIQFFGNMIHANELPKIPGKKFLGEDILQNNTSNNSFPISSMYLEIVIIVAILGVISGFLVFKFNKKMQ
jgi:hypothetical protein